MLLINSKLKEQLQDGPLSDGRLYYQYLSLEKENDRIALSIARIHSKEHGNIYENGRIPFVNLEKGDDLLMKDYMQIIDYPKTNPARDFFLFVDKLIDFESELKVRGIENDTLTKKIAFCLEICKKAAKNAGLAARQFFNMCKKARSNHNEAASRVKLYNAAFLGKFFGFDLRKRQFCKQ